MLPTDHVVSKCISIDFVSWLYKTDKVTKNIHGKTLTSHLMELRFLKI